MLHLLLLLILQVAATAAAYVATASSRTIPSRSAPVIATAAVKPNKASSLSIWSAVKGAWAADTFADFMSFVRQEAGDVVLIDLRPVLPPTYLLMGKSANRYVLSDADPSLDQVLQQLINLLPVAAKIPTEVDEDLQRRVSALFQSERNVNRLLPAFAQRAEDLCESWLARGEDGSSPLPVFFQLSEYVLLADLEALYGPRFTQTYTQRILPCFQDWVRNIAKGASPGTFFTELGELLREHIAERVAEPHLYAGEQSVLQVYLEEGALGRHDMDGVVGLLSMTLMAAVFNTQVSLAWILVHLYSQPELLEAARAELRGCSRLTSDYAALAELPFLNSCIDESVRLHTMLPGNTVVRRVKADVTYRDDSCGEVRIPAGAMLWLYPNAVHLDEDFFPEPKAFCPMRMLNGNLERMSSEYELVTFGHGRQRCIGEKMARAMICVFLGKVLPAVDATTPKSLPVDGFFDLIPASELRLLDVQRARRQDSSSVEARAAVPGEVPGK